MRPLVFGLTLAALSLTLVRMTGSQAYNDADKHGAGGTHYAQCFIGGGGDGHHTRWYYVNYSEQYLRLYNKFSYSMQNEENEDYLTAYVHAQVYWNAQGTRVLLYSSFTSGQNLWTTYSENDGLTGKEENSCYHTAGLHQTVYSNVWLNRFNLDDESLEDKKTVALHEVGHEINLGHSTQTSGGGNPRAVMYTPSLLAGFQEPQEDDVCGVNAIYRSNTYPVSVPPCHANHWIAP